MVWVSTALRLGDIKYLILMLENIVVYQMLIVTNVPVNSAAL